MEWVWWCLRLIENYNFMFGLVIMLVVLVN